MNISQILYHMIHFLRRILLFRLNDIKRFPDTEFVIRRPKALCVFGLFFFIRMTFGVYCMFLWRVAGVSPSAL